MPYSTYLPEHMGAITLSPAGPFIAGAHDELTLVYTAGTFGIDDTGMLKISWRTTSDMSKPQFDKPQAENFTTVEASNGAKLEVWFDRLNIRPWGNTLLIRVGRGYLRAGDTLTIRFGDRRQGSPGWRLQTNVEKNVELRTSVDAFATYEFCELDASGLRSGAGAGRELEGDPAVARACRRAVSAGAGRGGQVGKSDRRCGADLRRLWRRNRCAVCPPDRRSRTGEGPRVIEKLVADGEGDLELRLMADGKELARANPLRVVKQGAAAPLLGRSARAERRDHRHGIGR